MSNAEEKLQEAEELFSEAEDIFYKLLDMLAGDSSWPRSALKDRESFFANFDHLLERRNEYYEFLAKAEDLFTAYTKVYDLALEKFEEAERLRKKTRRL